MSCYTVYLNKKIRCSLPLNTHCYTQSINVFLSCISPFESHFLDVLHAVLCFLMTVNSNHRCKTQNVLQVKKYGFPNCWHSMGVCQRRSNIQIKSRNGPFNYVFYRQKQLIQGLGLAFHSMFTHTMILKPCFNIYTLHLQGQQHWYGHGHTSFEGEKNGVAQIAS